MNKTTPKNKLNPWFSMWTKPGATIDQIIENRPGYKVETLAMITGIDFMLGYFQSASYGMKYLWPHIIFMSLIIGPLVGLILMHVNTLLTQLVAFKMGSRASLIEIRTAFMWGQIPAIWLILHWFFEIIYLNQYAFIDNPNIDNKSLLELLLYITLNLVILVGYTWTIVTLFKSMKRVLKLSFWRTIVTQIPSILIAIAYYIMSET